MYLDLAKKFEVLKEEDEKLKVKIYYICIWPQIKFFFSPFFPLFFPRPREVGKAEGRKKPVSKEPVYWNDFTLWDSATRYSRCGQKSYSIIFSCSSPYYHFSTRDLFRQLVCWFSQAKTVLTWALNLTDWLIDWLGKNILYILKVQQTERGVEQEQLKTKVHELESQAEDLDDLLKAKQRFVLIKVSF